MNTGLFKSFSKEDIKNSNQVKSSDARKLREKLLNSFPKIADHLEEIWPKKQTIHAVKCQNNIMLYTLNGEILFFQERDGPLIPTLRVLHKYPSILTMVQVDKGAIKFVLGGARIMCPGLTSAGGFLPETLEKDSVVAVMAEGKQYALAIGVTIMSSEEMRQVNKGIGVENIHYCGDGLFHLTKV